MKTNSKATRDANDRQTNWKYRLEVKKLRAEGLSYQKIATIISESRGLEKSITRAAIFEICKKIKNMTIKQLEFKANKK